MCDKYLKKAQGEQRLRVPVTITDYNLTRGYGKGSKSRTTGHVFNEGSEIDHLKLHSVCLWEKFEEHVLN